MQGQHQIKRQDCTEHHLCRELAARLELGTIGFQVQVARVEARVVFESLIQHELWWQSAMSCQGLLGKTSI